MSLLGVSGGGGGVEGESLGLALLHGVKENYTFVRLSPKLCRLKGSAVSHTFLFCVNN